MRGRRLALARGLGSAPMASLPLRAQRALEGGFAGDVHALVGQHRHDARCWHVGKARLIGHTQHLRAFRLGQCVAGRGPYRPGPAIARFGALAGIPALQGASGDAYDLAGFVQSGPGLAGSFDFSGMFLAILEALDSPELQRLARVP